VRDYRTAWIWLA